jgi:hypothetical protein
MNATMRPAFLIVGKGTNSPVCVAGLDPDGNTCELKAQTPDGEIETGRAYVGSDYAKQLQRPGR